MKKGEIYEGTVERIEFPNKGVVVIDGEKAIVKNALPGQKIRFRINKKRGGRCEGMLLEVVEHSKLETAEDVCPHFGICGGCLYQPIPYEEQLAIKEKQVRSLLDAVCPEYEFEGILGSPLVQGYRNKMEFSFGDEVKDGSIIMRLLRPVHFAASYLFTELGSKWLIFISVGLPFLSVIVLMKILSGQGIVEVLGLTTLYLFSLTLAYLINFFFNICFGFSAFVFKNLWGSNLLKTSIVAFMSGSLIPLAFFPRVISDILSFLPFSSLIYTPVMIIVGKYDASQILQALLLQLFWLIVMVGLSQLIWKRVQSFITIQGG